AAQVSEVPRGSGAVEEAVRPFSEAELAERIETARVTNSEYGNLVEFFSLTGARWGELVELRVSDIVQVPLPSIKIARSKSDRYQVGAPKSRKSRRVPLTLRAQAILAEQSIGKKRGDLVFQAPRGGRINAGNFKRATAWAELSFGRRVHDLRHTAATNWLASGVDVKVVSEWLGHSTSAITHRTYIHYMGAEADHAALAKIEAAVARPEAVVTDISSAV
ncbi:MAG: recombinase XerD, partial [Microbacteriaceae bacterium]|nr:recombinase XerD [Microbacteriaceae bacterium]